MLLPACFNMADLFAESVDTFNDCGPPPGEGKPTKLLFY